MEPLEVKFVHHYTDRSGDEPVDYVPDQVATLDAATARSLIASKIAVPVEQAEPEPTSTRRPAAASAPVAEPAAD